MLAKVYSVLLMELKKLLSILLILALSLVIRNTCPLVEKGVFELSSLHTSQCSIEAFPFMGLQFILMLTHSF